MRKRIIVRVFNNVTGDIYQPAPFKVSVIPGNSKLGYAMTYVGAKDLLKVIGNAVKLLWEDDSKVEDFTYQFAWLPDDRLVLNPFKDTFEPHPVSYLTIWRKAWKEYVNRKV